MRVLSSIVAVGSLLLAAALLPVVGCGSTILRWTRRGGAMGRDYSPLVERAKETQ